MANQSLKLGYIAEIDPQLRTWYHKLLPSDLLEFCKHFGYLGSLLHVKPDGQLLESLITFWDPEAMVFRFGEQELTPTLEEYAGLLKLFNLKELARRDFSVGTNRTATFLGMKKGNLEKEAKGDFSRLPIDFLVKRFMPSDAFDKFTFSCTRLEWQDKRLLVLALCLFAHLLFPRRDRKVDMILIDIITQACSGKTFVPMVLAETLRALSCCKNQSKSFFTASIGLLQIWLIPHLAKGTYPKSYFMTSDVILPLSIIQSPVQGKEEWYRYLAQLKENNIQWYLGLCSPTSVRIRTDELPFIPLMGLSGVTAYAPGRVLRQFRRMQRIPLATDMSYFCFDYNSSSSKERCKKTLIQWNLTQHDEMIMDNCKVSTDPEYIKWMKKIVEQLPSSSKRPRTEEPGVQDHIKRLRAALSHEEATRTQVEQERDQLRVALTHEEIAKNQVEQEKDQLRAALDVIERERSQLLANLQDAYAKIHRLEHAFFDKAKPEIAALKEDLEHVTTIMGKIQDLTLAFPQGDFSSLQAGLETARTYMWKILRLLF